MATSGGHAPTQDWHSGLFGCFKDVKSCCLTLWFPCLTFGRVGEILDTGTRSCPVNATFYLGAACVGCPCVYTAHYRAKLRQKFGLPAAPCNDFLVHCFCDACAICQEYRELKARGVDPCLGWTANADKYSAQVAPQPPAMTK